ncbi:Exocyst complex component [Wickerhamomyces ciferrii]|uniref:Exocyst complex component SEC5 n=1 Tax=Wickerhamomyces ciferrii (strain ATCC 14091 / BCRC 22168 / CBS 111 / JCM 3599 / NBRC 0793 / NRRL Y-1031 F-60-10) TaxID=1206466 RepID=K0KH92_WICCF|nr:Exocyst complex component [Wickerhamomyces ciferrii]CCH41547.1 Exocyst complex component [Wickerhamomyces ciferrii]
MEEELLRTYELKTLNPVSWEEDTEENLSNPIISKGVSDEETYAAFLNVVNQDPDERIVQNSVDPLNPQMNIQQSARQRNIGVDDLSKFSINSKQFNSKQFLKFIHSDDSFSQLSESLNILESSISEKNLELRTLVESEFLRFVRSKSSLDGILSQFQKTGFNDEESGLKNLRGSVNEANKEATLLIMPILQKKQKEMKLKQALEFVEKKKFFFNLPNAIKRYVNEDDYDNLIHDYKNAKQQKADDNNKIINRIWEEVDTIIDVYKKNLWKSLASDDNDEDFLKNIKKLIEIDVIDNPVLEWIDLKLNKFISTFNETFNKYHEKILNAQLNILSTCEELDFTNFKVALGSKNPLVDSAIIIEMWLITVKLTERILEISNEFTRFWNHVEKFFTGEYQQKFDSKYIDPNSPFLRFEKYEIDDVKKKGEEFIDLLVNRIIRFFSSSQESLKTLHHAKSQGTDGTPDHFGFLPPHTNSLSSLKYLPTIYKFTSEVLNGLGQLSITDKSTQSLRDTSVLVLERSVGGVCSSWLNDCRLFHNLEDWEASESGETYIISLIYDFEVYIIEGLQKLLFKKIPDAQNIQIVKYPSKKVLTGVQIQFLRSFDVLLESIIKKIIEENQDTTISKELKSHHKLLTLANIKTLKNKTIPNILEKYDSIFEANLHSQNLEIYSILNKMEDTIFESFINEQRKHISTTLLQGVSSTQWTSISSPPTKVSSFIYESIHSLVTVYKSVSRVSKELLDQVIENLLEYTTSNLLKNLKEVGDFSAEGLRQVALDVEFLRGLFGKSAKDSTTNNLNLVYRNIFGARYDPKSILDSITPLLKESLGGSRLEYDIFNKK